MIIPHLHFCGDCTDAIAVYEKAFKTTADKERIVFTADGTTISHAVMQIHGQTVFLNDNFGNKNRTSDFAVHLILTFDTAAELLTCYDILRADDNEPPPFVETPYSELTGNFMDKFGVMWGFMVAGRYNFN